MSNLKLFNKFQNEILSLFRNVVSDSYTYSKSYNEYTLDIDIDFLEESNEKDILFALTKDDKEIWGFEICIGNFDFEDPNEEAQEVLLKEKKVTEILKSMNIDPTPRDIAGYIKRKEFSLLKDDFVRRVF